MSDFFDFHQKQLQSSPLAIGLESTKKKILSELSPDGIAAAKVGRFSSQMTALAKSEEFLKPASAEIGDPQEGESEDGFVLRAKQILRERLRKTLEAK